MAVRTTTPTSKPSEPTRTNRAHSAPAAVAVAMPATHGPATIIALQRTHGNRHVSRMLAGAPASPLRAGAVQRYIKKTPRTDYTANELLAKFKREHADTYKLAEELVGSSQEPRMSDQAIAAFLKGPVESDDIFYVMNVFKELTAEIQGRQAQEKFVPRGSLDGAEIDVQAVGVDLPKPVKVEEKGGIIDMHPTSDINFTANGSYKRPTVGGPWRVGMVQTLLHAHRELKLLNSKGSRTITIDVNNPHNDRRDQPPWYDRMWTTFFDKDFGLFNISLDDKPGMNTPSLPGWRLHGAGGADRFKTWLMLLNEGTSTKKFLHEWSWQQSYDPGGQSALTGETATTSGSGAVLDGPRATQDYQEANVDTQWNIPSLLDYKAMKTNAKKKLTPISGMMPVATYGHLRYDVVDKLEHGDTAGALQSLRQIKTGLDLMNQKTGYWKSTVAKTQHFTPILNDIADAINKISNL